jgi:DNA-directed RNA polymerase specialized sigma24 family protein
MAGSNSVTRLIGGLKDGEDEDIARLWDRYFERLVKLASARMPRDRRREFDEEDVALSAFHSFCDRAARGQFPRLADRDDLWRLLATLTTRKLLSSLRHQSRQKRGGGRVVGEAGSRARDSDSTEYLSEVLSREPSPAAVAELADECDRLFARLDDAVLKTIAVRKLEGFSSEEIAVELNISARTVDRKLSLIRAVWEEVDE